MLPDAPTRQPFNVSLLAHTHTQVRPAAPRGAPPAAQCWEAVLPQPLSAGQEVTLEASTVYAGAQVAFPAEVEQGEQQLMVFSDNAYVLSPYQVSQQTTEVSRSLSVMSGMPTKWCLAHFMQGPAC